MSEGDTFFGHKNGAVTTQVLPLDAHTAVFSVRHLAAAQCPLWADQAGQCVGVHWSLSLSAGLTSFRA